MSDLQNDNHQLKQQNDQGHKHDQSHAHTHDHDHDHDANPEHDHDANPEHDHDANPEHDHSAQPRAAGDDRYWLSLEQWNNDSEFQKIASQEFMSSPLRAEAEKEGGWARREFLKLMGASLAMASAGCLRRPVQKIVPYNKQPEEVTLGIASHYSSTYFDGSEGIGLLVRTREGRPIKIEGNEKHPLNKGGTSARAQAHLLALYDPERLRGPRQNLQNAEKTNRDSINAKWDELDEAVVKQLGRGSVVVLTGAVASPSTRALIGDFCQAFAAKHVSWEPLSHEDIREGQKASYGDEVVPFYRFDKAQIIVSIDADFLGTWLAPTTFTRQFSGARKEIEKMNRLVMFDSNYSLTGANADLRIRIKPSQQLAVVMGLAHEIVVKKSYSRYAQDGKIKSALQPFSDVASRLGMEPALFSRIAQDLIVYKGQSLFVAGGMPTATESFLDLQVAVNFLNSALDNDGKTVEAKSAFPGLAGSSKAVLELIEGMAKGNVKTVVIHKTNPLYSLPESFGFKEALKKVEMVIYTGDRSDETGRQADYIIPDNHSLEAWGDLESAGGYCSIQQPTIRPMYDTRSLQLSLMTWAFMAKKGPQRLTTPETYYDYLRAFWKTEIHGKAGKGKAFEDFWEGALQDGFVNCGSPTSSARAFRTEAFANIKPRKQSGFEVVLYPTIALGDGTLANVSWLQELPDPITKICWDNYVNLSLATAEKMAVSEGSMLELSVAGMKILLPAHIQPGLHDEVLSIPIGYGRTGAGKVGNNIGLNAFSLAQKKGAGIVYSGMSAELRKTGAVYKLANPQGHHSLGDSKTAGRKIVVEATLAEYLKNKAANNHNHEIWSLWAGHQYNGNKWGMAIDLNSCTGCNACVIACQSENNIPVVGKKYVIQGREMAWIRIDRYFVGDPTNAAAVFQPIMCQHCDNAPCETVCPVLATVHNSEGLNEMIYNRCVGTRYCANNCPYKVRRFNWFNFTKVIEKPLHLALNPDVTVRSRGVMEKCSFCVHRIKETKNVARLEGRSLKTDEVKTACQTACPASAITFGDINDPESAVAKAFKHDPRSYALLEEFHAAPAVRYQTKIRNKGGYS